jgi:hypothetical protein
MTSSAEADFAHLALAMGIYRVMDPSTIPGLPVGSVVELVEPPPASTYTLAKLVLKVDGQDDVTLAYPSLRFFLGGPDQSHVVIEYRGGQAQLAPVGEETTRELYETIRRFASGASRN